MSTSSKRFNRIIHSSNRRRGGGGGAWSPSDDADCVLWLAASNVNDPRAGYPVTTWTDNSGQSNDLTQTSTSLQPTYEVAGVIPVVRFDGSDSLQAASAVIDLTNKMSWFAVVSSRIVQTASVCGTMSSTQGRLLMLRNASPQEIAFFVNGSVGYAYPANGIADDTLATYSIDCLAYNGNSGTHSIRVDGVEVWDGADITPTTTNNGNFTVGSSPNASLPLDGEVADLICFSREADAELYTNVSAYWSATYGL